MEDNNIKNKKSYVFIIVGLIVAFGAGLLLGILLSGNKKEDPKPEPEPVEKKFEYKSYDLGIFENSPTGLEYLMISNEDVLKELGDIKLDEKLDFDEYHYVLVPVEYDECSESDVKVKDYSVENNKLKVNITYHSNCGLCAPQYIWFLFRVPKELDNVVLDLNYQALNDPNCDPNISYKPLIYIYPTKTMNVEVKLGFPELLTTTYPKYTDSWNVVAHPNGDLYDLNGKYYYGLYWEGLNHINTSLKDGFVVKGSESAKFLEEKLAILGLNEKEANEFIIYWLPKLEENEYNFIRFESMDVINREMPLEVTPTPDTMIRVLMEYKPLNKEISVKEQQLTKVERKGYTVVEWGGTLLD